MKGLVVYFSHTGENSVKGKMEFIEKGFTEILAEKIAKLTKSDLYKLEEEVAYPTNYEACVARAKDEYEANKDIAYKPSKKDVKKYNPIYLGFPIWWRGYPRIISSFLKNNEYLKGKTVIPFCTNEEGAFGFSELELRSEVKEADLKGGFVCRGHDVDKCDADLKKFLEQFKK